MVAIPLMSGSISVSSTSVPSDIPVAPVNVVLQPHQIQCYGKIRDHFGKRMSTLLCGPTGSGKTIICIKLAKIFNLSLFVVGPANIEGTWTRECNKYGVKLTFISYSLLAGRSGVMNHPYVTKYGDEYITTAVFRKMVVDGMLLVFDECQNVKNPTSISSQVCYALSWELKRQNALSRILLVSGTPFDKEVFAESMYKLMAVIRQKELFFYNVGYNEYQLEGYGYNEALEYCNKIDPKATALCKLVKINAKQIRLSLYDMFIQVIKPHGVFTMPRPNIAAKFIPKAGYYKAEEPYLTDIKTAIGTLHKALRMKEGGEVTFTQSSFAMITPALVKMERAKIPIFESIAKRLLTNNHNCKVIMYLWYDDAVDYLLQALKEYNPLRCDGKVNKKKRDQYMNLFQEPNLNHRVIIAKPAAFGVGISLDDTDGRFPRHTIINPSYYFDRIHQAAGRAYRANTMSDAYCNLVYVKDTQEKSIIEAIYRKTHVTKSIVLDNLAEGTEVEDENVTIFPADYPIEILN